MSRHSEALLIIFVLLYLLILILLYFKLILLYLLILLYFLYSDYEQSGRNWKPVTSLL